MADTTFIKSLLAAFNGSWFQAFKTPQAARGSALALDAALEERILTIDVGDLSTPNDLSGCVWWVRADSITALGDGTGINAELLNESTAGGNHPVQATLADRPLWKSNIQNGLAGMLFSGTSLGCGFDVATSIWDDDFTAFFLLRPTALNTYTAITSSQIVAPDSSLMLKSNKHSAYYRINGGGATEFSWDGVGSGRAQLNENTIWTVRQHGSSGADGNTVWSLMDGEEDYVTGGPSVSAAALTNTGAWFLGNSAYANRGFTGYIFEVIVYNRILKQHERHQVEKYLTDKWGL